MMLWLGRQAEGLDKHLAALLFPSDFLLAKKKRMLRARQQCTEATAMHGSESGRVIRCSPHTAHATAPVLAEYGVIGAAIMNHPST